MQRYFVDSKNWQGQDVLISGEDVHHITRVMRLTLGDKVLCSDNAARQAICVITVMGEAVQLTVSEWLSEKTELAVKVTLVQSLPKGDKLELIAQKATELGVAAIIPFQSERAIVKWDEKKQKKKIDRLQKIIKEASEQSHRSHMPVIEPVHHLKDLLEKAPAYDHLLIAYEETTRALSSKRLSHYFNQMTPGDTVLVVIGPEGGLTEAEVAAFYQHAFYPVRFGTRILRTETAPLYFLSALSYYFEEME